MSDAIAIAYGETRLTYRELIERSLTVAAFWLKRAKAERNMRILILHEDPLDIILSVLAAWSLDSTAAVLRPYGSEPVPHVYVDAITPDLVVNAGDVWTGACMFAQRTPLTYFYGLVGGTLTALRQGATIFLYAPPCVPSVLQADVRNFAITVVQGTPSFHRLAIEFWNGTPFENVRVVTQGGEPCGPRLAEQLASVYPLARHVQVFGMTEGGRISHRAMNPASHSDAIGEPFPHVEWKIVPLRGRPDCGRLAIRGPSVMLGYVDSSRGYWGIDEDGFFLTNDLVARARDGLRLLGRYDRCFKSGGKFVNPAVVESFFMSQRDIKNALCRAEPHDILGQVPIVQVVFEMDAGADVEQLRALCARELEPHMVPREIVAVPELPSGPGGKTVRRESSRS